MAHIVLQQIDAIYFPEYNAIPTLRYTNNIAGSWSDEIVYDLYGIGYFLSIQLDADDKVHIFFEPDTWGIPHLTHAFISDGFWNFENLHEFDKPYVDWLVSKIDAKNDFHFAFVDTDIGQLQYLSVIDGQSNASQVDFRGGGFTGGIQRLDSLGREYFFRYDEYWVNDSAGYSVHSIPIERNRDDIYNYQPLIDAEDQIHLFYSYENLIGKWKIDHLYKTDGDWTVETIDLMQFNADHFQVGIDSNSNIHLIYWRYPSGTYHAVGSPGQWVETRIDDLEADLKSLVLEPGGVCHVAYAPRVEDGYGGYESILKYATNVSGEWENTVIDSRLGSVQAHHLALGSDGQIGICYTHKYQDNLQYAYGDGGDWILTDVTLQENSANYCRTSFDDSGQTLIVYGFSYYGINLAYGNSQGFEVRVMDNAGRVSGDTYYRNEVGRLKIFYDAETGFYEGNFIHP